MNRRFSNLLASRKLLRKHNRSTRCYSANVKRLSFEQLESRKLLTKTVNTLIDENDGIGDQQISLRDAVAAATPGETINFSVYGTFLLTLGEIRIDKSLTILGGSSSYITIDASGNDLTPNSTPADNDLFNDGDGSRVFNIDDLDGIPNKVVSISGVTITGADNDSAIRNVENLTVTSSIISANVGVGVSSNVGGALVLNSSSVINNYYGGVTASGGGSDRFQFKVLASRVANNTGVGIKVDSSAGFAPADVVINRTTISDNELSGLAFYGGLPDESGVASTLTIGDSTFARNGDATVTGGGMRLFVAPGGDINANIFNSTISGNQANTGGGISVTRVNGSSGSLDMTLTNVTISNNQAETGLGGGIYIQETDEGTSEDPDEITSILRNSIVAGNTDYKGKPDNIWAPPPPAPPAPNFYIFDAASQYNLVGSGNTERLGLSGPTNKVGSAYDDPRLAPLGRYGTGGTIETHALLFQSPAIDAGSNSLIPQDVLDQDQDGNITEPIAYDNRGRVAAGSPFFGRVWDGLADGVTNAKVDIGAFEQPPPIVVTNANPSGTGSLRVALTTAADAQHPGWDQIVFDSVFFGSHRTIFTSPAGGPASEYVVNSALEIAGRGANVLTVSGTNGTFKSRVFRVDQAAFVRIGGMTIENGGNVTNGAGISNQANLLIENVVLHKNNASERGGGIYSLNSDLTIRNSLIGGDTVNPGQPDDERNLALLGAGIYVSLGTATAPRTTRIEFSSIERNQSTPSGGTINVSGTGTFELFSSTVAHNFGIGVTTSLSANSQQTYGNSTISNNTGTGIVASGQSNQSFESINNTIASNAGAGISAGLNVQPLLRNTIVALNQAANDIQGNFDPNSRYNLIGRDNVLNNGIDNNVDSNGVEHFPGNQVGGQTGGQYENLNPIDPRLGALANNGGPLLPDGRTLLTRALLTSPVVSPAIDKGDPNSMECLDGIPQFDQRGLGFARIIGGRIDIGSFEVQSGGGGAALSGVTESQKLNSFTPGAPELQQSHKSAVGRIGHQSAIDKAIRRLSPARRPGMLDNNLLLDVAGAKHDKDSFEAEVSQLALRSGEKSSADLDFATLDAYFAKL